MYVPFISISLSRCHHHYSSHNLHLITPFSLRIQRGSDSKEQQSGGGGICLLTSRSLFLGAAVDVFEADLASDNIGNNENSENNESIENIKMSKIDESSENGEKNIFDNNFANSFDD